jgi:hypothetical protein
VEVLAQGDGPVKWGVWCVENGTFVRGAFGQILRFDDLPAAEAERKVWTESLPEGQTYVVRGIVDGKPYEG